jgi:peptidoglycan/LPS O-acetylase OafA/YrhL
MKIEKRLLELDCLRGIAATMVVVFHLALGQSGLAIFNLGSTGVELFFVISGFVIFLTIEKTTSYKSFLLSRFARLYPAYWACLTLTTVCIILWSFLVKTPVVFPQLKDYLVNITMFQYYFKVKDIDDAYWTLIIELLFYVFILIVYMVKMISKIEILGFFIVLFSLLYGTIIKTATLPVYNFLKGYLPILAYFPLFIAGIAFYKIKFYKVNVLRLLLLALCLITQILLFKSTNKVLFITQGEYAVVIILIFGVFFLYCFDKLHFILNDVIFFMGKISYSLYLINGYISIYLLMPILMHSKYFHFNFGIAFLIATPAIIITATLINKFIEVPASKYLKNFIIDRN